MANSLYETGLRGIMVVVLLKRNIQSKKMNTAAMIPCRHVLYSELGLCAFYPDFLKVMR